MTWVVLRYRVAVLSKQTRHIKRLPHKPASRHILSIEPWLRKAGDEVTSRHKDSVSFLSLARIVMMKAMIRELIHVRIIDRERHPKSFQITELQINSENLTALCLHQSYAGRKNDSTHTMFLKVFAYLMDGYITAHNVR